MRAEPAVSSWATIRPVARRFVPSPEKSSVLMRFIIDSMKRWRVVSVMREKKPPTFLFVIYGLYFAWYTKGLDFN
eukprot:scaffold103169_cov19-Prasinocladus_malaysianus.AAC.1